MNNCLSVFSNSPFEHLGLVKRNDFSTHGQSFACKVAVYSRACLIAPRYQRDSDLCGDIKSPYGVTVIHVAALILFYAHFGNGTLQCHSSDSVSRLALVVKSDLYYSAIPFDRDEIEFG